MSKRLKLFDLLEKESLTLFAGGQNIHTPKDLILQILENHKFTKNESILVMYAPEFVIALIELFGIDPNKITFFSDHENKDKLMSRFGVRVIKEYIPEIKFDTTISNVPYNSRESSYKGEVKVAGGKMGTVGNKALGKNLNRTQRFLTKDNGTVIQMGLKGSMLTDAITDPNWNPELISLMVDRKWWTSNTFWVIGTKTANKNNYKIYGSDINSRICAKIFKKGDVNFKIQQDSYKQLINKGMITDVDNGNPLCIVRNYKRDDMQLIKAYPTEKGLKKVIYGPKFMHYMAESAVTWLATDEPVLCDCSVIYPHNSITEAEKQKLFTQNNPLLKFTWKVMNLKGQDQFWQYCRKFDLNQVLTGYEYPTEYGLTQEEQEYLNEFYNRG
jgi:hypothetical protein